MEGRAPRSSTRDGSGRCALTITILANIGARWVLPRSADFSCLARPWPPYAAVTLLRPGTALDRLWELNKTGHAQLASVGKVAGLGFVLLSALLCATSAGWFRRRHWGWFLGTSIVMLNAVGDLVNLSMGERWKGAVGVAIAGLLLVYMFRRGVRNYFRPGIKMK
jgi:hypothetical protein